MPSSTIAIIGAGFSGTLLALHALRHCPAPTRVVLIERNARFGRGQAYSTGNPSHLLNVPAGRMSAFHDRPDDFIDWLRARPEAGCDGLLTASCFVSRGLFGTYIRELLKRELRRPELGNRLELLRGEVLSLDPGTGPLTLTLDRDRTLHADLAVLAVGNLPTEAPSLADPGFYDGPLYRADPWAPDALTDLDPDAPVMLIGTGLTMVDVVSSLLDRGHRGPIHALSRRGLLPHRHSDHRAAAATAPSLPTSVTALLRSVRQAARRSAPHGWQSVVDGLRPFTLDIWQAMSMADRRRFLRHLRRWWDIHRHRMAGAVADRIDLVQRQGVLRIHAGWLCSLANRDGVAEAVFRPRGSTELAVMTAARVVNCSGPGADYARIGHRLMQSFLRNGIARPDPLRLGLDVTPSCALLDRSGVISRRLFAVGPATRGAFWEMTAVPDLRRQCEALAMHLGTLIRNPACLAHPGSP